MAATATPVHDSTDCNRTPPKPVRAAMYYNVHYTVSVLLLGWSEHKKKMKFQMFVGGKIKMKWIFILQKNLDGLVVKSYDYHITKVFARLTYRRIQL